jgi:hypothetical protein
LGGGPPSFTRGSTSPVLLWESSHRGTCCRRIRDFHPLWYAFPGRFRWQWFCNPSRPLNPGTNPGLGCVRFRSPLLTESMSLSVPAGTEIFQFPAFASVTLCVRVGMTGGCPAAFPHSEIPGSTLVCQLPGAYRRLPRPSSSHNNLLA